MRAHRDDLLLLAASLLTLVLYLTRERAIAGAAGFPLDDSWIHLHFARNIAEGAGFSYNPHHPVAGSTAPLWTLLLGAAARLAGASLLTAKVVGVATTISAAFLLRRAALAWGLDGPAALTVAVLFLWAGPVAWGALSGMEVSLAALLVSGALLAQARDRSATVAILLSLAVLARPEAVILIPLFVLAGPITVRRVALFAVVAAVLLTPFVLFSLVTVGSPIPSTASAKIEGGLVGWLRGVHEAAFRTWIARPREFLAAWFSWLFRTHWLLPLAVLPGVVLVWRRKGWALAAPALALIVHPLAMALIAPYRDPGFQEGRYSMHLLPLALLVLAVSVAHVTPARRSVLLAAALAVAVILLPRASIQYAWGVQNINAMQVHLGRWLATHVARDAQLAVNDIGAIAYFSRRPVIDLMGLVTPEILPYRRRGEPGVIEYVQETCPDYVVVFPAWFPQLTARDDMLEPIYRVRLTRNEVSGADEMVIYRFRRCAV